MPTNVIMPALGVAQENGTLLKWLKAEGESVAKGEPIMEIETDKATVEIEAAASGLLSNVAAKPGDVVPVGQTIALILAPGEHVPAGLSPHPTPLAGGHGKESGADSRGHQPTDVPQSAVTQVPLEKRAREQSRDQVAENEKSRPLPPREGRGEGPSQVSATARVLASPKARRIAKEKHIDLKTLHGSGPQGAVLAADVLRGESEPGGAPQSAAESGATLVPLTPMRRIVGERMAQSKQTAPHFYVSMDIDMSAVDKRRSEAKQRGDEAIPSINDFILYACACTLKNFRSLNASFTEQGIKLHGSINLGLAVALEEGLVVPVLRDADRLSLIEIARQSRELAEKAQNKKLFPLDYEGGTFTVSNLGMLGVDSFIAIINPPQCAILAVGRVAPRAIAENDMFAIKPIMTASLSVDHRVVDGATAARFLQSLKLFLESPDSWPRE